MIALGFLSALYLIKRIARTEIAEELDNFAIVGLMAGLVGARLWFVILNSNYYLNHPIEIHQIWLGGQSIQGGLIGGIAGTWLYDRIINKRNNSDYLYKLSLIAIAMPLAQAIGRWGNFFNEEAFGAITTLPWGLYISHTGQLHHPTFLYESLGNLVIFTLMLRAYKSLSSSQVIGLYFVLYSCLRLVIESIRTDSLLLGGMPAATVLSWGAIVIGLILIIAGRRKKQKAES
jgi:phosphatidylglycerol:prolipoprotein diacylglycerol transferase